MPLATPTPSSGALTGIGWRQPHYAALLAERPALGFLEVHAENFFMPGGAARALLREARAHYPVSLHGVGLSLGSAQGLDRGHLRQLAALVHELAPLRVSDHAAFARGALGSAARQGPGYTVHASDLLPLPHTHATLARMVSQVQQVQDALRQPLAVENISAYLQAPEADWSEPDFLSELARRSGCRLLLDINNLIVNALNQGAGAPLAQACAWMDAVPTGLVNEIHLAGHSAAGPDGLVIDDHGARVSDTCWAAYAHALRRFGAQPTLIEWDTHLPALPVLLDEAGRAQRVATATLNEALAHG